MPGGGPQQAGAETNAPESLLKVPYSDSNGANGLNLFGLHWCLDMFQHDDTLNVNCILEEQKGEGAAVGRYITSFQPN